MLDGKTVLVTGVGTGLGGEVAALALRDGANVVVAARSADVIESAAGTIDPEGGRTLAVAADVTDAEAVRHLVDETVARFGGLDAVIQVAAFEHSYGGLHETDLDTWRQCYEVNVIGALTVLRAAVPAMESGGGGAVVLIGSQSMFKPQLPQAGYAASKGGLLSTMYYLADELGPKGIRVNMVVPSWMWGPPVQGYVDYQVSKGAGSAEDVVDGIVGEFPLRRMAADEEVAEVAIFFASDRASALTGQHLMVNCGELMR